MGPHVEANSLSDITQIASNPPKYPRNPTEKQRQPLTLYIARVPGSQDIILTTLKPQLKNVTAEDVSSSLYYLHLNTEDDARLLAEEEENAIVEEPAESNGVSEKLLSRKPLPGIASPSLDLHRSGELTMPRPAVPTGLDYLHRKPLPEPARSSLDLNHSRNSQLPGTSTQGVPFPVTGREYQQEVGSPELPALPRDQIQETVQRRPLGSRPLQSEGTHVRKPPPGVENQPLNSRSQVPDFVTSSASSDKARSGLPNLDSLKPGGSAKSFSITVIRRDPSSGAQWNIGSVIGEGLSGAARANSNAKRPYFDISVHLTTPGYTYFRNSQALSFDASQSPVGNQHKTANDSGITSPDWGFDRQLRMEGSNIWDRSQQHKRSRSDILSRSTNIPSGIISVDNGADTRDSGSKGYVFLSPWGGRCKFSTGGGGRSLRCKHTLPDSLSSSNAVFESSGSAVVSELRFNLPHSAMFKAPATVTKAKIGGVFESGRFSIPHFGHIRNELSHDSRPPLPPRQHPTSYAAMYPSDDEEPPPLPPRVLPNQRMAGSSDEHENPISIRSRPFGYTPRSPSEDEDERLDLSIGQEKAGGGNRGKRAKLGKVIIYDEGFKMLDLIVAANMGVWWSVYGV